MGRPLNPGTAAERAQRRREMVRANVREHRRRRKEDFALTINERNRKSNDSISSDTFEEDIRQNHLDQALKDARFYKLPQPPLHFCIDSAYRDAFISALSQHFRVPEHGDEPGPTDTNIHVNVVCGSWMNSACASSMEPNQEILSDALLTAALAMVGRASGDGSILLAATTMESKVLATLREQLSRVSEETEGSGYIQRLTMLIMVLAVADLLVKGSWKAFSLHLKGVAGLIELAGPAAPDSPKSFDQFFAYRAVQVPFSFLERKRSFLARPEWIKLPNRETVSLTNPSLQQLIDIIYRIPSLMQGWDEAFAGNAATSNVQILEQSHEVATDMLKWERDSGILFPWSNPGEEPVPHSGELDATARLDFCTTLTANIATFLLGARVALHDLILSVIASTDGKADVISALNFATVESAIEDVRIWIIRALQCINTFRELEPRTMGKLVCFFPLDMAWKAAQNLQQSHGIPCDREIQQCQKLGREFENTGLPVLRTF